MLGRQGHARLRARRALALLVAGSALAWAVGWMPALGATRIVEKDLNLDVARRTAAVLGSRGVRVVMTRDRDVFVPLGERTALVRRTGADAFISIHHNAGSRTRTGTEIYRQVRGNPALGSHVTAAWRERFPGRSVHQLARANGAGGDYYFVLRTSPVPALIVEGGYVSTRADARRLADPAFRQAEAEATATGVLRWIGTPSGPDAPDLAQGTRITVDALPVPAAVSAVVPDRSRVDLGWDAAGLVEAYRIYRDGRLIAVVDNPARLSTASVPARFTDPWVRAGATYRYEIRAIALRTDAVLESQPAVVTATLPTATVVVDAGHGGRDGGAATTL